MALQASARENRRQRAGAPRNAAARRKRISQAHGGVSEHATHRATALQLRGVVVLHFMNVLHGLYAYCGDPSWAFAALYFCGLLPLPFGYISLTTSILPHLLRCLLRLRAPPRHAALHYLCALTLAPRASGGVAERKRGARAAL